MNESPRQAAAAETAGVPLSRVPVGWRRTVLSVEGPGRAELEREGLLPGSTVVVTTRTPFGGPLVVELGRTRLAISAEVAAQVSTAPSMAKDHPG